MLVGSSISSVVSLMEKVVMSRVTMAIKPNAAPVPLQAPVRLSPMPMNNPTKAVTNPAPRIYPTTAVMLLYRGALTFLIVVGDFCDQRCVGDDCDGDEGILQPEVSRTAKKAANPVSPWGRRTDPRCQGQRNRGNEHIDAPAPKARAVRSESQPKSGWLKASQVSFPNRRALAAVAGLMPATSV